MPTAKKSTDPSAGQSQTTAGRDTDPGATSSTVQDEKIVAREAGLDNAAKNSSVTSSENDNVDENGNERLGPPVPSYEDR